MEPPRSNDTLAPTHPLDGMPAPRWDRKRQISPTSLRHFLECPHRCRLQYVDKVPFTEPWDRGREVGTALHSVMERIANTVRAGKRPPAAASLRAWIGNELLPEKAYDNPDDRIEDIDKILEWAHRGTQYITHGTPTILRVERHYPRHWEEPGALGKVLLGAKADLVILRQDRIGRYVEIIDYKSGYSRRWTQFTPILSSIALKRRIRAALPNQKHPRVMFSYLWFAHGERERIPLTVERKSGDWTELKQILVRLVHEDAWPKQPSPRACKYCPYYNTECFPGIDIAPDGISE